MDSKYLVGNRYWLKDLIGSGSFGDVYRAFDQKSNKHVAVKVEKPGPKYSTLEHEVKILKALRDTKGFPACKGIVRERDKKYMVM
jgi:serine/threonine protein kinase